MSERGAATDISMWQGTDICIRRLHRVIRIGAFMEPASQNLGRGATMKAGVRARETETHPDTVHSSPLAIANASSGGASLHLLRQFKALLGRHCGHDRQVENIIPIHYSRHD
jgi:hypothetical protein